MLSGEATEDVHVVLHAPDDRRCGVQASAAPGQIGVHRKAEIPVTEEGMAVLRAEDDVQMDLG